MVGLNVLVVDDDSSVVEEVRDSLVASGHRVESCDSIAATALALAERRFDVLVLDRLMEDGDIARILPIWREDGISTPVILLTSMTAVSERIAGLDAGADDYLPKPFDPGELEARVRSLARRASCAGPGSKLICGSIEIDRFRREVRRNGVPIPLQPREFKLLEELALHPGEVVSRYALLSAVWNLHFDPRTKLIESHVSRLRDKVNAGHTIDAVETVRGIGYRLRQDA